MNHLPRWKVTLQIGRNRRAHTTAVWCWTEERARELAEVEAYNYGGTVHDVERSY